MNVIQRLKAWHQARRIRRDNARTRRALEDQIADLAATGEPVTIAVCRPSPFSLMWIDGHNPVHVRMALAAYDSGALVQPLLTPPPERREAIGRALAARFAS